MISDELIGNLILLEGRYSRFNMFRQFAKRTTNELVCLTHQLNFIFSLQKYLHRRLVCSHAAAVDTTRTEQTIIVTHQQVTLDLCECVKHHTDKDQQ